ncbi:protein NRT1/ PTR FAMILY 5.2-like [Corylus avellana]|uniref:protein NRT1/ PTR FAMILY 5.2-like n=1 Tax=Corylus avellana TaxID=13451 RepID=UPI002869FFB5|nr:protein NRT1/ PTR FAMILY 5.2-like [Corylus avellana]
MALVGEAVGDEYTQDGTVNLKGKPVRRSKSGGWTACWFIVVYEVFERMAYYGISSNLILYLTKKLHEGTVSAANNVTNWVGTIWLTPILGAYVADAHLGRYWTFIIACIIYFLGMSLITLAVSLPSLKPPGCSKTDIENCKKASTLQLAVFYGALYTLAVGTGGTKPNISTMGADQFDDFDPKEKAHKLSFFNWWYFSVFIGTLFANTFLVWVQDNVGWTLGYALPTLGLVISISIFLAGTPFYRHKVPAGSPFTRMAKVIVAAIRKWRVRIPNNPKELYELDLEEYAKKGKFRIDSTPTLKFLTKASVKTGSTNPWMLCSVTQVEETKQMLRVIPIWVSMFVPSAMIAQTNTLFVKQDFVEKFDDISPEEPVEDKSRYLRLHNTSSGTFPDREEVVSEVEDLEIGEVENGGDCTLWVVESLVIQVDFEWFCFVYDVFLIRVTS